MTSPGAVDRRALAAVAFGVFVAADDLMVVATMLRPIIDDLGLVLPDDLDATAWIVNVYLIAYLTVMPLAGRLSDRFGRRSVFVAAMALFALGSVVVPLASSLPMLLVGRALSALGGGALVPIAFATAGDLPAARRPRALGLIGAIETLGWVWGPLYGALLVRFLTWEWQFYLNLPLALVGAVVGWRLLPGRRDAAARLDLVGAALLSASLVSVNVALLGRAKIQTVSGLEDLRGGSSNWTESGWVIAAAIVSTIGLVAWLATRRGRPAILAVAAVRGRRARAALVVNVLASVGLVVALVNVPLFINVVRQADGYRSAALVSGVLLTALTGAMAVASYGGGRLTERLGLRRPSLGGLAVALVGFAAMGWGWDRDTASTVQAVGLAVAGVGLGLALAPTSDAVVGSVDDRDRGSAAGLVIMARLFGFSIGLASLTAWGLHRYEVLRDDLVLPALGEEGFEQALADGVVDITTTALAETFVGSALALVVAIVLVAATFGRAGGPVAVTPGDVSSPG